MSEMKDIWDHESIEAVQLAAVHQLESLGLAVPRGEPNLQCKDGGVKCSFGTALSNQPTSPFQWKLHAFHLPRIFAVLIQFLEDHVCDEGLFRKAGSISRQRALRRGLECSSPSLPSDSNPHDVASILKQFLRELPHPLLPTHYWSLLEASVSLVPAREQEACLHLICLLLPSLHLQCLCVLMDLLARISKGVGHSLMDAGNLAVVMAPNLLETQINALDLQNDNKLKIHTLIVRRLIETSDMLGVVPHKVSIAADEEKARLKVIQTRSMENMLHEPENHAPTRCTKGKKQRTNSISDMVISWGNKIKDIAFPSGDSHVIQPAPSASQKKVAKRCQHGAPQPHIKRPALDISQGMMLKRSRKKHINKGRAERPPQLTRFTLGSHKGAKSALNAGPTANELKSSLITQQPLSGATSNTHPENHHPPSISPPLAGSVDPPPHNGTPSFISVPISPIVLNHLHTIKHRHSKPFPSSSFSTLAPLLETKQSSYMQGSLEDPLPSSTPYSKSVSGTKNPFSLRSSQSFSFRLPGDNVSSMSTGGAKLSPPTCFKGVREEGCGFNFTSPSSLLKRSKSFPVIQWECLKKPFVFSQPTTAAASNCESESHNVIPSKNEEYQKCESALDVKDQVINHMTGSHDALKPADSAFMMLSKGPPESPNLLEKIQSEMALRRMTRPPPGGSKVRKSLHMGDHWRLNGGGGNNASYRAAMLELESSYNEGTNEGGTGHQKKVTTAKSDVIAGADNDKPSSEKTKRTNESASEKKKMISKNQARTRYNHHYSATLGISSLDLPRRKLRAERTKISEDISGESELDWQCDGGALTHSPRVMSALLGISHLKSSTSRERQAGKNGSSSSSSPYKVPRRRGGTRQKENVNLHDPEESFTNNTPPLLKILESNVKSMKSNLASKQTSNELCSGTGMGGSMDHGSPLQPLNQQPPVSSDLTSHPNGYLKTMANTEQSPLQKQLTETTIVAEPQADPVPLQAKTKMLAHSFRSQRLKSPWRHSSSRSHTPVKDRRNKITKRAQTYMIEPQAKSNIPLPRSISHQSSLTSQSLPAPKQVDIQEWLL